MIYEQRAFIGMEDGETGARVRNRAILRNFEDAASSISDQLGYGSPQIEATRCTWLLLNWQLQVYRRPGVDERLSVRTWVRDIHRIYSSRDFELCCGDEVCAAASSKWTYWNIDAARPERISDAIAQAYGVHDKAVFPDPFGRVREPEHFESCLEIPVRRSHIDINGHTHNLFYLDFAMDALPEELFPNGSPDFVSITYRKETRRGDLLRCFFHQEEGTCTVVIRNGEETNAIVQLR